MISDKKPDDKLYSGDWVISDKKPDEKLYSGGGE